MLEIGVILFVIWDTTWDTKLVASAAATHAASKCCFCSWPQGQPNRCKDQSPKSFQKIHVQESMAAWRLPNHKQLLQLRFNMTLSNFDFDPIQFKKKTFWMDANHIKSVDLKQANQVW